MAEDLASLAIKQGNRLDELRKSFETFLVHLQGSHPDKRILEEARRLYEVVSQSSKEADLITHIAIEIREIEEKESRLVG